MIALSFLLAFAGLAAMGLSQARHHDWAFRRTMPAGLAPRLRWGGLAMVALSLAPAMLGWGAALGAIGWFGLLSLAAFLLILARTYLFASALR
jgi:Protein of unknown function (DUF3325)